MADRMRWRFGRSKERYRLIAAETVIEIGDMVYDSADGVRPASDAPSLETFVAGFLGVAMQRSLAGQANTIRIESGAAFEFDCDDEELHPNGLVSPAVIDGRLQNQRVARAESRYVSIGRTLMRTPSGSAVVNV
jgi:hypothetical protein